jgi:hypothetical protein
VIERYMAPLPADYSLAQLVELSRRWFPPRAEYHVVTDDDGVEYLAVDLLERKRLRADRDWLRAVAQHIPQHPTPEETAAAEGTVRTTIEDRARQAYDLNVAFLANASPSNAQVLAQVRLLTRECNALIRLVVGMLDSDAGT